MAASGRESDMLSIDPIEVQYPGSAALRLPALHLESGEHCLLLGPSGCGKTTLLHVAAGLLRPARGRVRLADADLSGLRGSALDRFRGRHVGIVFQRLHLIASLTVLQNLAAAQYCAGLAVDEAAARDALDRLGIADKAQALPAALSQGQAQRAGIARAIVNRPRLILADEPTASLDDANAMRVIELLTAQARECGAALLIATHDARVKYAFERRIELEAAA
jgi:ABC-type lipoprotein export system ATPase subunit